MDVNCPRILFYLLGIALHWAIRLPSLLDALIVALYISLFAVSTFYHVETTNFSLYNKNIFIALWHSANDKPQEFIIIRDILRTRRPPKTRMRNQDQVAQANNNTVGRASGRGRE